MVPHHPRAHAHSSVHTSTLAHTYYGIFHSDLRIRKQRLQVPLCWHISHWHMSSALYRFTLIGAKLVELQRYQVQPFLLEPLPFVRSFLIDGIHSLSDEEMCTWFYFLFFIVFVCVWNCACFWMWMSCMMVYGSAWAAAVCASFPHWLHIFHEEMYVIFYSLYDT